MASTADATSTASHQTSATYDAIGYKYEVAFADLAPQQDSLAWLLNNLSSPAPDATNGSTSRRRREVLDIGSGTGRPVASTLAAAGHNVHGIDISAEMVRAAREKVPEATFEQVDARMWQPSSLSGSSSDGAGQEGFYDAVTAYFSMMAGFSQADIRAMIGKVHGWLRPGGLFVLATLPLEIENATVEWMGYPWIVSSLSAEEYLEVLRSAGFEIVDKRTSRFLPKAVEAGICASEKVWEEEHLFIYAKKRSVEVRGDE